MRLKNKLLLAFIFCFLYCFSSYASIGVVGNSLAANMSFYNEVDWDLPDTTKHCAWITNHAVGGDGWISSGVPYESDFWNFGHVDIGYGKGYVNRFLDEANYYDSAIIIIGSNELTTSFASTNDNTERDINLYIKRMTDYLNKLLDKNKNIKIIFYLIPSQREKDDLINDYAALWNSYIKSYLKHNFSSVNIEEFKNPEFVDKCHFTREYNQKEFRRLVKKYNLS